MLYILLSIITTLMVIGESLDGERPAAMILKSFDRRPQQNALEIGKIFTDRGLFESRLESLQKAGLIKAENSHYVLTRRGKIYVFIIDLYGRIFAHHPGGL